MKVNVPPEIDSVTTEPVLFSEASQAKKPARRMQFLDVIRAIAASAVLLEHTCEHFFKNYLVWANNHFTLGVFGVVTFFLVSGFIIPVSLERYKSLKTFWIARAFRLYPIYWASIVLSFIFARAGLWAMPDVMATHPAKLILANVGMVQLFFLVPNIRMGYWTLSIEVVFYLLISAVFATGLISRSLLWAWIAIISNLIVSLFVGLFLHRSLPAGSIALLITALFATAVYRAFKRQTSMKAIYGLLPALTVSLLTGFWFRYVVYPTTEAEGRFTFQGVSMSYLGAYLLFFFIYSIRNYEFPRILLWLGQISYSLYLIHGFVIVAIPDGPSKFFRIAAVAIISIITASLTYKYIERPPLALHKRLMESNSRDSLKLRNAS